MVLAAGIFFCLGGAVLVRHSGFDPESVEGGGRGGQTLSQAQGDRLAVAAGKRGHASFAERRVFAVAAGGMLLLRRGAC